MYKITHFTVIGAALLAAGLAAGNALAADKYPTKPIRFIVPFPPGGGTDIVARVIAQRMIETLGQQTLGHHCADKANANKSNLICHSAILFLFEYN